MANNTLFTEQQLRDRGFIQNEKGEWMPAPKQKPQAPAPPQTMAEQNKLLKKLKRGKYPESNLQQRCVSWFRGQYPQYYWLFFAIPNGGFRNKVTANIIKAEGAISGVWDLFFSVPVMEYNGLYIEMKIKPNTLTDNQQQFKEAVQKQGYATAVCYDFEQFQDAIKNYLIESTNEIASS